MNRKEAAEKLTVSTNTVKNWFGNLGLNVPDSFDMGHITLLEIYKLLASKEPKLSDEQIIGGCLPFMQSAKVTPVDPSTHPLTAGSGAPGVPATAGAGGENTFAALIAETMEVAAVELAPIAAAALVRGLNKPDARSVFKDFVGHSLRSGVDDWITHNVPGVTITPVASEEVLPVSEAKGALPEASEPAEQPVAEDKA